MDSNQIVSIVVTTKNEEQNIENCLQSIKSQTWKSIELLVIDNNSIDKTVKIAEKYTKKVYSYGPERSAQRNFGLMHKSSGSYLMYVDADMMLSPYLVESCMLEINKANYDALYIEEIILGSSLFCKVRNFERSFYSGTPIDAARFFTREIFSKTGGFDEELFKVGSGEDWDLDKSIKKFGGKIGLLPRVQKTEKTNFDEWALKKQTQNETMYHNKNESCIYHNEKNITLQIYIRKKSYYAKGFDGYITKWGKNDDDIKKQFGFWYRYIKIYFENKKWKMLIKKPHLTLLMYCLRVIVGAIFITRNLKFLRK